jgi:hypothetical protein
VTTPVAPQFRYDVTPLQQAAASRLNANNGNRAGQPAGPFDPNGGTFIFGHPHTHQDPGPMSFTQTNTGPFDPNGGTFTFGNPHGGSGMPLDTSAQIAESQAKAAKHTFMRNLELQQQGIKSNYGDQLHDFRVQHPYDIGTVDSNFGGRGLGFSSGFGQAQEDLGKQYKLATGRLGDAKAQALAQVHADRQDYQREYLLQREAIRQAAADRLSANAGHLGLGKPTGNAKKQAADLNGNG